MTEKTTGVPAEEKTFGTDMRPVLKAYREEIDRVLTERDEELRKIDEPFEAAAEAIRAALPGQWRAAEHMAGLLDSLSKEKRQAKRGRVIEKAKTLQDMAQERRDEALKSDPLAKYVVTVVDHRHGEDYADILFEAMPLTFDRLKELAHHHKWCDEFENMCRKAVAAGALPDDMVTVTRSAYWAEVPAEYGAQEGEVWEVSFTVPAYVRTVYPNGDALSLYDLHRYVVGPAAYWKVSDPSSAD